MLRYTLCSNAPETKDNDFTWKDFQLKNNSELVAILGNFVNRTLVLTHKFYQGRVPARSTVTAMEEEVIKEMAAFPEKIGRSIETYRFREALAEMMNLARLGNKYLTDTEPWKLIKNDPERTATVMNLSLQICANLAVLCAPFLPFTADKMHRIMNLQALGWKDAGRADILMEGHQIDQPKLLFEQISDETIQAQVDKLQATKEQNALNAWQPAAVKENVTIDDFGRMDIRVGTILECQKVPKADKLLQFKIEDGMGTRTIVSGIAKYYPEPQALVGKQVCFIANFPPRKLKGVESQGMILSAEDKDGRLVLLTPRDVVTPGCNVG